MMRAWLFLLVGLWTAAAWAGPMQDQLVQAAADMRAAERQYQSIEGRLQELETKRSGLEKQYEARRADMARTLAAMVHVGRTPREAVLIRPGGPVKAARTTMLLSASLPAIEVQAQEFRQLALALDATRNELTTKAAQAKAVRGDLYNRHSKLSALLEQRDGPPSAEASAEVARLARDARSLRELLGALGPGSQIVAPSVPEGEGQLPVSGIIRIAYGGRDTVGAKSNGLSIETLAGTVVVAPLGGVVRYAGPFRGYGNIVIIAHSGGYHSLVAGLDKIGVKPGQVIVSGEPIAILDAADASSQDGPAGRRTVYYELRYGGRAVDPSRKLPDLG